MTTTIATATSSSAAASHQQEPMEVDDEEEDEQSLDEEQLDEYREEVEQLGSFPDKVKINSLSIIASDHAESKSSANAIYQLIRFRLLNTQPNNILPLVYVIDSILKNVKGFYITIFDQDAPILLPQLYTKLNDTQRIKLEKVYHTWNEFHLFSVERWKMIGQCFGHKSTNVISSTNSTTAGSTTTNTSLSTLQSVAGIPRKNDGTLIISSLLRKEMQNILDDLQNDLQDELEKVSLERLADIKPDLLENIKKAAEDSIRINNSSTTSRNPLMDSRTSSSNGGITSTNKTGSTIGKQQNQSTTSVSLPSFFMETRSVDQLEEARRWTELKWESLEQTHDVITKLQQKVREGTTSETTYTIDEAIHTTQYYAAASATASLLKLNLERIKNIQDRKEHRTSLSFPNADNNNHSIGLMMSKSGGSFVVDREDFTNDGIKKKNDAAIALLYELGLPFISSADGRRFRTQIELSDHLDSLFRKNQLEKSIARTEERDWYPMETIWTRQANNSNTHDDETMKSNMTSTIDSQDSTTWNDNMDPSTITVPADESRDRCAICGINFKMFFDQDEGMYRYSNCREIDVLNDDAAERESDQLLVHVTCWRGLGAPDALSADQTMEEVLRH